MRVNNLSSAQQNSIQNIKLQNNHQTALQTADKPIPVEYNRNLLGVKNYTPLLNLSFKGINKTQIAFGSALQDALYQVQPVLPKVLASGITNLSVSEGEPTQAANHHEEIQKRFPNTYGQPIITFDVPQVGDRQPLKPFEGNVGVILSGGQAPGGHNVVSGLFDGLKEISPDGKLYGFLGGPDGVIDGKYKELTSDYIDEYRNTGGFDIIGSGRGKIETEEQLEKTLKTCKDLNVKSLVVIGGDDSNTNAAVLAEYFQKNGAGIKVIGVPKTIDGDLKNEKIETSFGFDTATKVYSELIGNVERDALSAKKYWHFIKLMGRDASNITLECALQTHPNVALVSEEVEAKNMTLNDVVSSISDTIANRSKNGKNYGVVLIPEGLVQFIPEMKKLTKGIDKVVETIINDIDKNDVTKHIFSNNNNEQKVKFVHAKLDETDQKVFSTLPQYIQEQLVLGKRDAHGNFSLSQLDTQKLLMDMVSDKIKQQNKEIKAKGGKEIKFAPLDHFFGYEGRCSAPSMFDLNYCYALGYNAAAILNSGKSGYMSSVSNLADAPENWTAGGTPITSMLNMEERKGKQKPVIKKSVVDLNSPVLKELQQQREKWAAAGPGEKDCYDYPGSIQYWGPVSNQITKTLEIESKQKA